MEIGSKGCGPRQGSILVRAASRLQPWLSGGAERHDSNPTWGPRDSKRLPRRRKQQFSLLWALGKQTRFRFASEALLLIDGANETYSRAALLWARSKRRFPEHSPRPVNSTPMTQ
jgi:hypothetical protein